MPDWLVEHADLVALGAAIIGFVAVAVPARRSWASWRRARVTQQAATALLDVHLGRLDETLRCLDERTGTLADDGEQLAESLAELRAGAAHLRWMVAEIPEQRDRLARELYELVLPTGTRDDDT